MGGFRKFSAATAVVIAGAAALAPAAGAIAATFHRAEPIVDHISRDGGVEIGTASVTQNSHTALVGAHLDAGALQPGTYRVNLVYGSASDLLHPHVKDVCKLVIGKDGSGSCESNVHAQTDAPGVNALAVTITKPHGALNDPVAVSILRMG